MNQILNYIKKNGRNISIILLAVLAIVSVILASNIVGIKKMMFENGIKDLYEGFIKNEEDNEIYKLTEQSNKITGNIDMDFDIKVDEKNLDADSKKILDLFNNYNLNVSYGMDKEKNILNYGLKILNKNDSIEANFYGKDSNFYIELKDIYDKLIKVPYEQYNNLFENNEESAKYLQEKIIKSFYKSLEEKDFKSKGEKIKINEKEIKTTKISYVLTEKKLKKILKNILNDINKDEEAKKYFEQIFNQNIDELSKNVEEIKDFEDVTINIYMPSKNKFAKLEILVENNIISYSRKDEINSLEIKSEDKTVMTLLNQKTSDNTYKTEINIDSLKIELEEIKEENKSNIKFNIDTGAMVSISGSLNGNVTKNSDTINEIGKLNIKAFMFTTKLFECDINTKADIDLNGEIKEIDYNNSVLSSSLNENDTNKMLNNLMNKKIVQDFLNLIK